jgi:phosphatidate cytidylyltransferase
MTDAPPKRIRFGDLGVRLASGVVLAALVLVDLWLGGLWVVALAAVGTALMFWEYHRLVTASADLAEPRLLVMGAAGVLAIILTALGGLAAGACVLVLGATVVAVTARPLARWLVPGMLYIGLAMCFLVWLRIAADAGLALLLWLILVVIAADVGAYFVGRMIGGPRLWPAVSPGKTWSGALGGLGLALVVGVTVGTRIDMTLPGVAFLSLAVAVASQLGDLLESAVKRRYNVKDASALIPGHGGLLDRLDGILGALWFLALYQVGLAGFGG